jgi:hypothetical protein
MQQQASTVESDAEPWEDVAGMHKTSKDFPAT